MTASRTPTLVAVTVFAQRPLLPRGEPQRWPASTGWASTLAIVVPPRYHVFMAMNLRLSDDETEALRQHAELEGRSMQEVARTAIAEYVSGRPGRLRAAIERVRTEDAELLARLAK
jgi:predicted transcriptional regulator